MAGFGLRALDLASGEATDLPTSSLFHVIACDPKDSSKLLGTASDFTSMPGAAVGDVPFHLKSYDTETKTEATVGTFPASEVKWGGYDGIFSFTQDGTEVWAAWPADECPFCDDDNAKKGGHVHIMDTSSGEIKTSTDITFGGTKGTPYFLLPDEKRGVFATKTGSTADLQLKWADLEVGSKSIKANIGSTDASDLWISSESAQRMCGDHLIAFSKGSVQIGASSAKEILPATGAVVNSIDLRTALDVETDRTFFGAVACLESPTPPTPPSPTPTPPAPTPTPPAPTPPSPSPSPVPSNCSKREQSKEGCEADDVCEWCLEDFLQVYMCTPSGYCNKAVSVV
jgi:hypothetical protein